MLKLTYSHFGGITFMSDMRFSLTGEQVKEIRKRNQLSQKEFGAKLGVTHAHISKIESGKENPSETLLKLIAYEFNLIEFRGSNVDTDLSRNTIKNILEKMEEIWTKEDVSENTLFMIESILSAIYMIYKTTQNSKSFQTELFDAITVILYEISMIFAARNNIESNDDNNIVIKNKLKRSKIEMDANIEIIYKLLEEYTN